MQVYILSVSFDPPAASAVSLHVLSFMNEERQMDVGEQKGVNIMMLTFIP